ncbi:MAG: hypothetical protein QOC81_4250 [Thermoanaerobaculia bacterium]|nr:hypothetical protein [Thermoanaerobaculia bacterium]
MKLSSWRVLFLIVALVCVNRCATRPIGADASFLDAAKAAGAPIHADDTVTSTSGGETFSAAPITTWERTPATALRNGADIAFVYSSADAEGIPKGYYTLRAVADVTAPGTLNGTVQFIDRQGNVAAKLPATAEVHSMTVPEAASTRRSYVTVTNENGARIIVICCTNGTCWIIVTRRLA